MLAVDTNVLVFAHRSETPHHDAAVRWVTFLSEGSVPWGLPVFCIGEFVRVVTHSKIFDPPSTIEQVIGALESLLASPSLRLLNPGPEYHAHYFEAIRSSRATGNLAFDAQIAAVCREHGVTTLLTDDRDFSRFPGFGTLPLDGPPTAG